VLDLIRQNIEFQVVDAQSGEDITRSVLIQIITEQESGNTPLFTNEILAQFIRLYDDTTRNVFTEFLERNFQLFTEQQKALQEHMGQFVGTNAIDTMTKMTRKNFDMWQEMQSNFFKTAKFDPDEDDDNKDS
jgi:polyhydroxyalkanoate synthesis repressor PhaR